MSDPSWMYDQMTLGDILSATSSLESEDGAGRLGSQGGMMAERCGQEAALASHSRSPDSRMVSPTSATFGQSSSVSSRSEGLQSSLESKLRQRLNGSVECEVIWKKWISPWGQSLSKPRAQVRVITGIDIGLWPTMTSNSPAKEYNEAGNSAGQVAIRKILMGLYPTASSRDWKDTPGMATTSTNRDGSTRNRIDQLPRMVYSLWSTLRASDGEEGGPRMNFGAGGSPLPSQVFREASSSNAPTEGGFGSLHPEFAGWEMGYPPEWLNCAPSATPSSRRLRQSS
jgi:hypothetical protein